MGGDSHGHGKPYEIPDWRKFKVEDVPELLKVQRMLAEKGLKDPWLRNEVWRFDPGFGSRGERIRLTFFRGFRLGFVAFVATIAATKAYELAFPPIEHSPHH